MAPTATRDRVCAPLGNCSGDEYEAAPETATSDRVCEPLTVCGAAEYQSSPPTATKDRECTQCTVCDGVFEVTACSQAADTVCESATGDPDAGADGSVEGAPTVAGGCGCMVSGTAPTSNRAAFHWISLLALVALVAVRRRLRHSRRDAA
jgi:hypothetical protein